MQIRTWFEHSLVFFHKIYEPTADANRHNNHMFAIDNNVDTFYDHEFHWNLSDVIIGVRHHHLSMNHMS